MHFIFKFKFSKSVNYIENKIQVDFMPLTTKNSCYIPGYWVSMYHFHKENWFHSSFSSGQFEFFFYCSQKLEKGRSHLAPKSLEGHAPEEPRLSRVSNWIKMGRNGIEDALAASFHIINISLLSSRRGIYKIGMTTPVQYSLAEIQMSPPQN